MNKINKLILLFFSCLVIVACSSSKSPIKASSYHPSLLPATIAPNDESAREDGREPIIGGWAPVFFTAFDKPQLDHIAEGLKSQTIKRAVISYPTKMEPLADQIHDYLESATQQNIPLKSIELKDTSQVKYNLTQVIVTLYFN